MKQEHHSWISPALGREMHLEVFGHAGARVLVFPTTLGSCYEWRDRHMHEVLADHLDHGTSSVQWVLHHNCQLNARYKATQKRLLQT